MAVRYESTTFISDRHESDAADDKVRQPLLPVFRIQWFGINSR